MKKIHTRLWCTVGLAFFGTFAVGLAKLDDSFWFQFAALTCGAITATCGSVLAFYDKLFPLRPGEAE